VRCPLFPDCRETALIRSVAVEPLGAIAAGELVGTGA
jgi:hypothetical protein